MKLTFRDEELHFDSAHYLPGIDKCENIHGHVYIIKSIELDVEDDVFIDFRQIKDVVDTLDHVFFIPIKHIGFWNKVEKMAKETFPPEECPNFTLQPITETPIVEKIAVLLKSLLLSIKGVKDVRFELYEGLDQGCVV